MRRASLSTSERYSAGAIALHWAIALALAFQLALGFAMPKGASGFALFQLHKSVGITILALSLARLAWRLTHRPPPALERGWQGGLATAVHVLLYVFMIGAPLTGWALVSTAEVRVPTVLFGTIPWPHLPLPLELGETFESAHELLAWVGLALIALHIAGALRHQLFKRDGLLGRMGFGGSAVIAGILGLLVVGTYFATGMTIASRVVAAGGYPEAAPDAAESAPDIASTEPEAPRESPEAEVAAPTEPPADTPAPPPAWTVAFGGRLGFEAQYQGQALRGTFPDWQADIAFDPDSPQSARIAVTVRLASATLGDATQDEMLRRADGLGSGTATWRSSAVRQTGPGRYRADGTLSLKGLSRPQSIDFTLTGQGRQRRVEGSASIDRMAFGIDPGTGGAGDLGPQVSVTFAFAASAR